ncbi:DUF4230 domain-containing protein [Paratractidigestivibacter sp.]|uniref:DUF4230 domain-containing protein n=1 Tax=Paratractidigestivibacter sp. TaxID=2847316 RepID=UPI002ACB073E|nr:DUF4230 domain-containing protein [Paratractidigestivibacter sp.]
MKKKILIALLVVACAVGIGLAGFFGYRALAPQQAEETTESETTEPTETAATSEEADFSSISDVASLTTIEACYHHVAKFTYEADEGLTGVWKHGYKKAWREYDAKAYFGIDASKVTTSREEATVTVKMPHATLVGEPKITGMGNLIVETGFWTDFTDEDEQQMSRIAQEGIANKASNDTSMINRATENAQKILKQWAQSVGKAYGEDLTVEFEFVD